MELPKNEWIFISTSIDYGNKVTNFFIDFVKPNGDVFSNQYPFPNNYPSFQLRKKLKLDLGCFSIGSEPLNEKGCIVGKAKGFNFLL